MSLTSSKPGVFFGVGSLLMFGLAALLFYEIVRPFRDNNIDQPLVLVALGLGAISNIAALFLRKGAIALNAFALTLNVAGLIMIALIALSLSHMKLM